MRTRLLRRFVTICFLAAFCYPANAAKYNLRWVMIHEPSTSAEEAAADFAARVDKDTGGEVHVEVLTRSQYQTKYGGGKPVTPYSVMRRLISGDVEICQTYSFMTGQYAHALWALGMPYLFRDYEHAESVFEGPVGRELLAALNDSPMRALGFTYSGGFGAFATKDIQARQPDDLRQLRIKVAQGLPLASPLIRGLDIEPIIAPPEAFVPLAQAGMADGVETTFARLDALREDREARFVTNTEHFLLTTMIVVNDKFFKSLPARQQALIREAARDVARKERAATIRLNADARKRLEQRGVKVLDLTAEQKEAFRKALEPDSGLTDVVPQDVVAKIRSAKGATVTVQKP